MSAEADLRAAAGCIDNQAIYVEMVELEAASTYGFQGHRWLADAAPHLLPAALRDRMCEVLLHPIFHRSFLFVTFREQLSRIV
jgi:hypothetical protein